MQPNLNPLSRRQFLRRGALLAGATAALGPRFPASAAAPTPPPVIDTHIHLYDTARPGVHWPPREIPVLYSPHLPAQFQALTQNLGVSAAIVIEANAEPDDNLWVLDLAKTNPAIAGYIGRLTPGQPGFAARFDRYAQNPVFRGLRLRDDMIAQGLGQAAFEKDLRRVAERGLTLDIVGSAAVLSAVPRIAKIVPHTPLVIDHLPFGEWDRDPALIRPALREAAALPNVYAKISSVLRQVDGRVLADQGYYASRLDILWELLGDDRVLYGSNWPVSDLIAPYAKVYQVVADYVRHRGEKAAGQFFWKNSVATYGWLRPPATLHPVHE